jgi:hypothetical protein
MSVKVKVRNVTPIHAPSLCATCDRAQVVKGYRESKFVVISRASKIG